MRAVMLLLTLNTSRIWLDLRRLRLTVNQSFVEGVLVGPFVIFRVLKSIDLVLTELRWHIAHIWLLVRVCNINDIIIETTFFL